jgi:hypothetical protein
MRNVRRALASLVASAVAAMFLINASSLAPLNSVIPAQELVLMFAQNHNVSCCNHRLVYQQAHVASALATRNARRVPASQGDSVEVVMLHSLACKPVALHSVLSPQESVVSAQKRNVSCNLKVA